MVEYIYYTGIGAKKNGKHTIKEFLNIMNKNYKTDCSEFLPELNYKPCSEYKEMNKKTLKSNMRKYVKSNMKYKPILDYNNRTCKQHQNI